MADETETMVEGLAKTVQAGNLKTIAEMAAWSTAQAMQAYASVVQDQVVHRKRLDVLAEKFLTRGIKDLDEVDPEQAAATLKLLTGHDLSKDLSSLAAAVAQMQQTLKGAQTTPPVTTT